MKKFFAAREQRVEVDVIFLLIRLIVGVAFMLHGWGKIQTPFTWMGPTSPVPGIFQLLAAIAEFGGGLGLLLGLFTRLAAFGISITMIVAVTLHAIILGDPFVNVTGQGGSYEPALNYLAIALLFFVAGPGRFSLDRKVFGPAH